MIAKLQYLYYISAQRAGEIIHFTPKAGEVGVGQQGVPNPIRFIYLFVLLFSIIGGVAQWFVLPRRLAGARWWIPASVAGVGIGWFLFNIAAAALFDIGSVSVVVAVIAIPVGIAQWLVLNRVFSGASTRLRLSVIALVLSVSLAFSISKAFGSIAEFWGRQFLLVHGRLGSASSASFGAYFGALVGGLLFIITTTGVRIIDPNI